MLASLIPSVALGIAFGTITGVIPGIHVNLVAAYLVAYQGLLSKLLTPLDISCFIVAMASTHTFIDIIPSVFLGAPSSDLAVIALPAHKLVKQGRGYEAVILATLGGLFSLLVLLLLSPLILVSLKFLYKPRLIAYFLLIFVFFFVLHNRTLKKKILAMLIFIVSGSLGLLVLNSGLTKEPLMPLLTGFFGVSLLLRSILFKPRFITSAEAFLDLKKNEWLKCSMAACLAGVITGIMPGIGASQAALIAKTMFRKLSELGYIVVSGGVNTINFSVSLFTFYLLDKMRNGAVVALSKFVPELNLGFFLLLIGTVILSSGIAAVSALVLGRIASELVSKVNYQLLCLVVLSFLMFITIAISGVNGLLVLFVAACVGISTEMLGLPKGLCMGCIMLPVLFYYFI